jgi:hypothetical protein
MMTFNDYVKAENGALPTGKAKTQTTIDQPVKQGLSRAKLMPTDGHETPPSAKDIVSNLSQQIIDINRFIVTDPSCAVVVKRLSEMIVRLHSLMLVAIDYQLTKDSDAKR